MHTSFKYLSAIITLSCTLFTSATAQVIPKDGYIQGSREQQQVQYLIDHSINYAENMLVKQGAYAPYAAALTVTDSVMMVDPYDNTKDKTLIRAVEDLKSVLRAGVDKGLYKAVVIYFDVTVNDPTTSKPTDATAAYTEQMNSNGSYTFYFPYKKTELKGLTHTRSFGSIGETEIFTKVSKN